MYIIHYNRSWFHTKKLLIIRHGESEANANKIIQGKTNDFGLTERGKQFIRSKIRNEINIFSFFIRIITSPLTRAVETADIISEELRIPIYLNESLEEGDSGILSGMHKQEAYEKYKKYYEIWKERKDLDNIPLAEKGENLQARVIGFISQYFDMAEYNDIIVTHAGFIRCLMNTIENRERTERFNIDNGTIFCINDIFKNLDVQERKRAMNSRVIILTTANGKFVVKLKNGIPLEQDYAEQDLLQQIEGESVPKVLSLQQYSNNTFCKVIRFVEGRHIYGKLLPEEYNALIESEQSLGRLLRRVHNNKFKTNNLQAKLQTIFETTTNSYIKEIAHTLLNSPYKNILSGNRGYVLSHDDLNRDNILFETLGNGQIRANIIDFESLEYAPKDFQFASMLASGMFLEGENIEKIVESITSQGKDVGLIFYFMQIRLLDGLNFFWNRNNIENGKNQEDTKDLLKRYFLCMEKLEIEKKKYYDMKKEDYDRWSDFLSIK